MIDYTASGVRQWLEFVLCDSRTLEEVTPLTGVASFSYAESWRGDYRQTGQIDIDGERLPLWAAVRVYVCASQGTETAREALCTLYPTPAPVQVSKGRETASYDLYSMMRKLDTNKQAQDTGVPAGSDPGYRFIQLVRACGAVPSVHPGCDGYSTRSGRVWEAGDSYLTEAHALAHACGGRVQPDAMGRVCLVPYQNPARVGDSFDIPAGAASVVLPELEEAEPEITNRVVASYSQNDRKWYSVATLDPAHPWSYERIGRWEVEEVRPPQIEDEGTVQSVLDALTARTLAARSDVSRVYSASMLYMPIRAGQAGTLSYIDGGASVTVRGFVSAREVRQDGAALVQEITLEEV